MSVPCPKNAGEHIGATVFHACDTLFQIFKYLNLFSYVNISPVTARGKIWQLNKMLVRHNVACWNKNCNNSSICSLFETFLKLILVTRGLTVVQALCRPSTANKMCVNLLRFFHSRTINRIRTQGTVLFVAFVCLKKRTIHI